VNRVLGVKEGQIPGYKSGTPQELKAAVSKSIAEKLLDEKVDVLKLAGVIFGNQVPQQSGAYIDVKQALKESPETGILAEYNVVETGTGYGASALASFDRDTDLLTPMTLAEAQDRVNELNASRAPTEQLVLAGSPEAERWATERIASAAIQQWATTSNNQHPVSLALQETAKGLFGLEETASWGRSNSNANVTAAAIVESGGGELRSFLSAQYEATQDYLKSEGITSIELFRGMNVSAKEYDAIRGNENGSYELSTRPLTSWSTNDTVAIKFGNGDKGVFLSATIPADRIFSLPLTGIGCLNEEEVVVLGGRDTVIARTVDGSYDPN
jgi:hypothetical protein